MRKRLTKSGNCVTLARNHPILKAIGIDAGAAVEGLDQRDVIVVTPMLPRLRSARLASALAEINDRYAGVFRHLAE